MHQVLCERGFINERDKVEYTVDSKKDEFGFKQNNKSFRYLLKNLVDFAKKESIL